MNKRLQQLISLFVLVIISLPLNIFGSSKRVQVTLPSFSISINGIKVDNTYRKYPFVVYKGVTYLPLTYYDSRTLGVETVLNEEDGLTVDKSGICAAYRDYGGKNRNRSSYTVNIASFPIKINGEVINNHQQEYPILLFRDIAYLPITTALAKDKLGMVYVFDQAKGLRIESSGPKVVELKLPVRLPNDGGIYGGGFALSKDYCYYSGKNGGIYQMPINNPKAVKKVYQLPLWYFGDGKTYVEHGFTNVDGNVHLSFQKGGVLRGDVHTIQLNPDGRTKELSDSYCTLRQIDNMTIRVDQCSPPFSSNIAMKYYDGDYETIGNRRYIYGWEWQTHQDGSRGDALDGDGKPNKNVYLHDNNIYMLACDLEDPEAVTGIYKINLWERETIPVTDEEVFKFKMLHGMAYYTGSSGFYILDVEKGIKEKIDIRPINQYFGFEPLGRGIYYADAKTGELYRYTQKGGNEPLNPGAKLTGFKKQGDYIICTFKEKRTNPYRLMVFSRRDKMIIKSADTPLIENTMIDKYHLAYSDKNGSVYRVYLKNE